jgi:hypothetical protein
MALPSDIALTPRKAEAHPAAVHDYRDTDDSQPVSD